MGEKIENEVLKLDRKGLSEKSKLVIICAFSLALLTVAGSFLIPKISGNPEKLAEFNVDLNDYEYVVRPSLVSYFGRQEKDRINAIDFSMDVSLSYNIINQDNVEFHMHPNSATLIDIDPVGNQNTDNLFLNCQSVLMNNFNMDIEDKAVEAIDVGLLTGLEDVDNVKKHPMYKIFSNGESMLMTAINVIPYQQIEEEAAVKASNPEGFTDAILRISNFVVRLDNFIGINKYEQDGVKLHGIVVQKNNGIYQEFFVLDNQYALEGKYQSSDLREPLENDVFYQEARLFPGAFQNINNVSLLYDPIIINGEEFYMNDDECIYLKTEDNKIIKTKLNNVQLLGSKELNFYDKYPVFSDSVAVLSDKPKDKEYAPIALDGFYAFDDNNNYSWDELEPKNHRFSVWFNDWSPSLSPTNTFMMTFEPLRGLDAPGFAGFDEPTSALINLPNYQGKIDVFVYRLYRIRVVGGPYAEYISLVFESNIEVKDDMKWSYYSCYNVPIEAVTLVSKNLEAGHGIAKIKTR